MTTTPRTVRAARTMTRIREADTSALYLAARRADAARNGYRGVLTRNELAEQTSRQFARAQMAAATRHAH